MAEKGKSSQKKQYKPSSNAASGAPLYKSGAVQDLKDAMRSQRRGFDVELNLTNKQAKKYSSLVEKARAEGVIVSAMKKKDYLAADFQYRSTGSTNVAGGFAQTPDRENEYRGLAAQRKFERYGGKIEPMKEGKPLSGKIILPPKAKNIKGLRLAPGYFGLYEREKPRIVSKNKKRKGKFGTR